MTWGTKNREPIIDPVWEDSLYDVMTMKSINLGASVKAVRGMEDHVHMAASVPPQIALATFIGQVKGNSSYRINQQLSLPDQFEWQSKYGVFSFGVKRVAEVMSYINNQRQHHKKQSSLIPEFEYVDKP